MRKLSKCELKATCGGESICFWASFKVAKVTDNTYVNGKLVGSHVDRYLGMVAPRIIPYKYGR